MRKSLLSLAVFLPLLASAQVDPVQSFEKIVATCQAAFDDRPPYTVQFDNREKKWRKRAVSPQKITYDVRKTDSLVSPLVGIMQLEGVSYVASADSEEAAKSLQIPPDTENAVLTKTTIDFSFQSGQWIVKGGRDSMYARGKPGLGFDLKDGMHDQFSRERLLGMQASIWPKCLASAK